MKYVKKWFMDLKIASKILICYFIMLFFFILLGTFTYQQLNTLTTDKVRQMSMETVKSINVNLNFLIRTLNNQTMVLISSGTLQNALTVGNPHSRVAYQQPIGYYLADSVNFNDMISSVYIFDNYGDRYYVDNAPSYKDITLEKIKSAEWYPQLLSKKGDFLLLLNGGGTFSEDGENYISLIRVVNNINTQQPIGYMVVNVSADYLNQSVISGNKAYNTQFILKDENGRNILDTMPDQSPKFTDAIGSALRRPDTSVIRKVAREDYIVSNQLNDYHWKIVSITPFSELTHQVGTYNIILLIFAIANVSLIILAFVSATLLISNPIHKLAGSMKAVENGEFREIDIKTGKDEIGTLKDVYNMMIRKIQILFDNIVQEQAVKRRKELEVLQSQIKPHFLYNSFDAVSALALSGDNQEVYRIIKALGKFYKAFLNAGNEEITVKDELEIVENYLIIQKIRFGDKFRIVKSIDERALRFRMPRLTLQPLVENAINHGIRPKQGQGVLTLRALYENRHACLIVEDDGVGMDADVIEAIRSGRSKGVGMRATVERLNLFYNAKDLLKIESTMGGGTRITITLPEHGEA